MEFKTLVFWQPINSPHYAAVLRELGDFFTVHLIIEKQEEERRKRMGWAPLDAGRTTIVELTSDEVIYTTLKKYDASNTFHIFSGTRAYRRIWIALNKANVSKIHWGISGEAFKDHGFKGKLKVLLARYDALRLRNNVKLILAKGELGSNWYQNVGYSQKKIYQWGYFIDSSQTRVASRGGEINFLFIGRFVEEKGIRWLLNSIHTLKALELPFTFTFIGHGNLKLCIEKFILDNTLTDQVKVKDAVSMSSSQEVIGQYDYLILPSTIVDGWGVVINESLHSGVPVIVSKRCGASTLIRSNAVGYVVNPEENESLTEVLLQIIRGKLKPTEEQKDMIRNYSESLTSKRAARYLKAILDEVANSSYKKISPPWILSTPITSDMLKT